MSKRQPLEWIAGVLGWTPGSDDQRAAVVAAVDVWEADRVRLGVLEAEVEQLRAQRDALVPLAQCGLDCRQDDGEGYASAEDIRAARAALAAIAAERAPATPEAPTDE